METIAVSLFGLRSKNTSKIAKLPCKTGTDINCNNLMPIQAIHVDDNTFTHFGRKPL